MMTYGERLRDARLDHGWSERQLASRAGIHFNTVWRTERELTFPSLLTQSRLAKALKVSRKDLFGA